MITISQIRPGRGGWQYVFVSFTADGDICRTVVTTPSLDGDALQTYCDAREDDYQVGTLSAMYPNARYQDAEGATDLTKFENWILAGHTNAAYCENAEGATQEACELAGGTWHDEEVVEKVPWTDSHDYTGDLRQRKLEEVRAEAANQIEIVAGYPQWVQNNVANGIYPSAVGDAMKAYIALVITESNRCEDLIEAVETLDEALAVTPTWPEV